MLPISHSVPPEVTRIRQLICRVGDEGADKFKKDIQKVVDVLAEYYQQNKQEVKDAMLTSFIQCAKLMPLKAGVYATILALLSSKHQTQPLTDQIILGLFDQLQYIAQQESPILGQTILKFLSELMNVGLLNTVSFVECLYDLQGGAEHEQSPFYLQILLTTLPHAMIKAMEKNQIEFKNIIQNVGQIMQERKTEDRLYYLWQAIRNFLNNQEKDVQTQIAQTTQFLKSSYPRPYLLFSEEMTQVKQIRRGFKIPIVQRTQYWRPQQFLVQSEKNDTKTDIQIEITRQWIFETIELFKSNKQQILLQIQQYQNCMQMNPQQENQFRQVLVFTLLNMVVETIPRKDNLSTVFFSGLLSNLSQRDQDNAKEWNELIDQFVDQVPLNNILVIEQLSDCLSHFYCNSNFKLNFDKLFNKLNKDETDSLTNYFVISTFRKLFSLVSIDKIKDLLPENLVEWYTVLPDITKPIDIKQQHEISEQINSYLQQKLNGQEINEQFQQLSHPEPEILVTTFLQCLLQQIYKSITHLNVLSKRYLSYLLKPVNISQEKLAELLLDVIYQMWNYSSFHLKVYLKEFLGLEVINNLQIIKWLIQIIQKKKDDIYGIYNTIIAVNDIFKKQIKLDQNQDLSFNTVQQIVQELQSVIENEQDSVIKSGLENILIEILIVFKNINGTDTELLLKDTNSAYIQEVVKSF